MRLAVDSLVALMLAAVLAGVVMKKQSGVDHEAELEVLRSEVRRFQQQIMLQSALEQVELNAGGFPETVDPEWFHGDVPDNPLLSPSAPWVEVADTDQAALPHPPDKVAIDPGAARFWYNPRLGIIRARVPAGISDNQALRWYNLINDCDLPTLFEGQRPAE
jgi:hypothetical protein